MALMGSFFKNKSKQSAIECEPVSMHLLKKLIPIRTLSEDKLSAFANENTTEIIKNGTTLFQFGESVESAIYLVNGTVTITDQKNNSHEIESGDSLAKFPLCSGKTFSTTATAKTDLSILRVSPKIMSIKDHEGYGELIIPPKLADNRLLELFAQHFKEERLEISSLPKVALKLREAIQQDIGIAEAANIVQHDPVISAKLIDIANCPLYLSLNPAKNCHDAIKRIGLNATQNLVTSFCIKGIYKGHSEKIRKYLNYLWQNSVHLSSLCFVLAKESKQYNPEEALLAGLVCDIGAIPFLNFVANLPAEYQVKEEIDQALPTIKRVVGAMTLDHWNFSDEFIQVTLESNNWFQNTDPELSLTDIVLLSRLHSQINQNRHDALPPIASIPASGKLHSFALSPENSLKILHESKQKIQDTMRMFA